MEVTPQIIQQIDDLRFDSPSRAHALALDVLNRGALPPEIAPGFFGALGSVLRMLNDFTGAERAVGWALEQIGDDPFTEGRLYQRLSAIREDLSDFQSAMQVSKKAATCFHLADAPELVTMTLFSQGRILSARECWAEGLDYLVEAHHRLGKDAPETWKASVLVQTALAFCGVGKPEEGLSWLQRSKIHTLSPWLDIRRVWVEARLQAALGSYDDAQELLFQLIDFFQGVNPIEVTLARVELAECHLAAGEVKAGRALMKDLRRQVPLLASRVEEIGKA